MCRLIQRFLKDDCGALLGTEWAFVATVLVLVGTTGFLVEWQSLLDDLELFVMIAGR